MPQYISPTMLDDAHKATNYSSDPETLLAYIRRSETSFLYENAPDDGLLDNIKVHLDEKNPASPGILDDQDSGRIGVVNASQKPTVISVVKETTSQPERAGTRVEPVEVPEPSQRVKKTRAAKRYNPEHTRKEGYKTEILDFLNKPTRQQQGYRTDQLWDFKIVPRSIRSIQYYLEELYEEDKVKLWIKDRGFQEKHRYQFWYSSVLNRNSDFRLRLRLKS